MTRSSKKLCSIKASKGALVISLPSVHSIVSWAPHNPGACKSETIAIFEVPRKKKGVQPSRFDIEKALRAKKIPADSVALLTAAKVKDYARRIVHAEKLTVETIATVGITNARSVLDEPDESFSPGTINVVLITNTIPSLHGRLEAVGVISSAKTAALRSAGVESGASNRSADATGTDCIVIASSAKIRENRAGLHTRLGTMIGRAVFDCVTEGIRKCG